MPTYDYRCDTNGRVVEVNHRMSERLANWGELCTRAGIPCGDTPEDSPIYRVANGGNLISSNSLGSGTAPPSCGTGGCCPNGLCGLN